MSPLRRRRRGRELDETQPLPRVEERAVTREVVEEPPPPRGPLLWPYLLLLLVLVLGGLGVLYYVTRADDEETVPTVVNLAFDVAVDRLTAEGFATDVRREPSEAQEGIVFDQSPDGGQEADEGSTVTLLVSTGPPETTVPNVVGLELEAALEKLDQAELGARQVEVFSEEPPRTVVAQDPAGGEKASRNSTVRINVSQGTGRVTVPSVVGETASDAGATLREAGLQARVVRVPSAEPAGTVIAQNPPAGTELQRGKSVRINVSGGSQPTTGVEIPDVTSLDEAEATAQLEAAGFAVRVEREPVPDETMDGIVLSQDPLPGERARRGAPVTITIGQFGG
jgi:eukaryotic-like serine/threonine-protein kinase